MIKSFKKAFTLVELIVVVTILTILSAIGFVSFSGYLAGTRDTNRISQLKSLSDGLKLYKTKGFLPIPDDYVEVKSSGSIIAYQGYVGKSVLDRIEYTSEGLDPKDKTYFSYYLTKNKKYYQLMGYLEENSQLEVGGIFNKTKAIDYSIRYPTVHGKKLGILTDENNTPIQEIPAIKSSGSLDIGTTNNIYIARFDDFSSLSGTGVKLQYLVNTLIAGGVASNCKILLEKNKSLEGNNGIYIINLKGTGSMNVYCDMTTDGGGWTLVLKANGNNTTFNYVSNYWTDNNSLNESNYNYDNIEFKSTLFNSMGFNKILLQIVTGDKSYFITINKNANSLLSMFNLGYQKLNISRKKWMGLVPGGVLQLNCNQSGINTKAHGTQARIGLSSNNENNCTSNDSALGIGLDPKDSFNSSVGSNCKYSCKDINGVGSSDGEINSFGYLYIK